MLLAVACFSCLDATAKYVNRSVDPLVTVWARYVVSVFLTVADHQPVDATRRDAHAGVPGCSFFARP